MFSFLPITPHRLLLPFVQQYLVVAMDLLGGCHQRLIPSNYPNIGFFLSGRMQSDAFEPGPFITRSYVLGQITRSISADYLCRSEVFTIIFKPAGMCRLLGIPMHLFTNRGTDFELVADAAGKDLVDRLCAPEADNRQRAALVDAYLLNRLGQNQPYSDRMAGASELILQKSGSVSIKELCSFVHMSERNFERQFIDKIGVSPKAFSVIVRMKKTMQMIESMPEISWRDIAYTLNYTDQAHFIHDFKKLAGKTPTEYYKSKADFEHFLYREL